MSEGLDLTADVDVSVFESNIRLLGGLLSAHLLASDPALGLYPGRGRELCLRAFRPLVGVKEPFGASTFAGQKPASVVCLL